MPRILRIATRRFNSCRARSNLTIASRVVSDNRLYRLIDFTFSVKLEIVVGLLTKSAYLSPVGVGGGRERPEEVPAEHGDDLGVDGLRQHGAVRRHVLHHLVQRRSLHLRTFGQAC